MNTNKSSQTYTKRANNRLGGESIENFSRTDALRMALTPQAELSDRILVSNEHHRQKLPLEEIFRWEAIIETL